MNNKMASSVSKSEIAKRLGKRMKSDDETASAWLEALTETFYEIFKQGQGASLTGFGSFYLDRRGDSCAFKFNPSQKLRALFGWSSTYKGKL
jgi:DNA-binding protein HU-beta